MLEFRDESDGCGSSNENIGTYENPLLVNENGRVIVDRTDDYYEVYAEDENRFSLTPIQSVEPMDVWNGENAQGEWIVRVYDHCGSDYGSLEFFQVIAQCTSGKTLKSAERPQDATQVDGGDYFNGAACDLESLAVECKIPGDDQYSLRYQMVPPKSQFATGDDT